MKKEDTLGMLTIVITINSIILSLWFALTHPIKTAEQTREETYKLCIERQTWSNKPISGQPDIAACELIKTPPPK